MTWSFRAICAPFRRQDTSLFTPFRLEPFRQLSGSFLWHRSLFNLLDCLHFTPTVVSQLTEHEFDMYPRRISYRLPASVRHLLILYTTPTGNSH
jgi:hypothetical protein